MNSGKINLDLIPHTFNATQDKFCCACSNVEILLLQSSALTSLAVSSLLLAFILTSLHGPSESLGSILESANKKRKHEKCQIRNIVNKDISK